MDPAIASAMTLFILKNYSAYDGKHVYIETGPGSFDGIYVQRSPLRYYFWWWLSSKSDQTVECSRGAQKMKYVARVGTDYAKILGGGVVGGLCEGLGGALGGAVELVTSSVEQGVRGFDTAIDGGRGIMQTNTVQEAAKGWKGDIKILAKGTDAGAQVAFDSTFVCGGCAEFKDWVAFSKEIKLRLWNKRFYTSYLEKSERDFGRNYFALAENVRELVKDPTYTVVVAKNDIVSLL